MDRFSAPNEHAVRYTRVYTLHASQAETASGQSATFDVSNFYDGLLFIDVTAVSGTTPQLSLQLQTQDPVSGKWVPLSTQPSIPAITSTYTNVFYVTNYGQLVRLTWTITGTNASFTFSASLVVKS